MVLYDPDLGEMYNMVYSQTSLRVREIWSLSKHFANYIHILFVLNLCDDAFNVVDRLGGAVVEHSPRVWEVARLIPDRG